MTPHVDVAPESELQAMAPEGVSIHATRVPLGMAGPGGATASMINPPWFPAELDRMGAEYFRSQGLDVVYHAPAALRSDYGEVYPGQLYDWARMHVPTEAEAIFVGGNGFRAIGAIQALEEDIGRPVLTANQVAFWQALRLAGVRAPVVGYGQLFAKELPSLQ